MRLLHFSDIHIGVETYGRPASQADVDALPPCFAPGQERSQYVGANTRLLDFLAATDYAVDYALNRAVDAVLFSGDAYKLRDPSQTHQREFARRIARLSAAGVPAFLTVGNHDLPHVANRATALEIFPTLNVENIVVGQTLETRRLRTRAGDLQVVALPWIRIGQYLARDETRGMTMEEIKQSIEARLADHLQEEIDALDPATPAVLCAHVTVAGATLASEQSMMLGNDHVLGLGAVARREFDYVALGHVHRHQTLTQNPPVVYAGSIERVDFGEERDEKGFVVVEIDPSKPRGERCAGFEFVAVEARPMLTIDVDVRAGEDPTDTAVAAIARRSGVKPAQAVAEPRQPTLRLDAGEEPSGAAPEEALAQETDPEFARSIVRLRVAMTSEQEPAFREPVVRQALAPAHYVAGIERRVQRDRRTRLPSDDAERLEPLNALRRYFEAKSTPAEREQSLIGYAERLLAEEAQGE